MSRTLKGIGAVRAAELKAKGALLVDVREAYEFAGGHIPDSVNAALSGLDGSDLPTTDGQAIVFLCASGARTNANASRLAAKAGKAEAFVLSGGIAAWRGAGLPVESGGAEGDGGRGFFSRLFG
jgi:rhodanese-related sulfurtransferase